MTWFDKSFKNVKTNIFMTLIPDIEDQKIGEFKSHFKVILLAQHIYRKEGEPKYKRYATTNSLSMKSIKCFEICTLSVLRKPDRPESLKTCLLHMVSRIFSFFKTLNR